MRNRIRDTRVCMWCDGPRASNTRPTADKLGCVLGVAGLDYGKLRSVEARRGGRIFEWRCRLALIVFQSAKYGAA